MIGALNLAAATTSGADFPDVSQLSARPELPDSFVMLDGRRITTAEQWNRRRRPELKALFQYPAARRLARADRPRTGSSRFSRGVTIKACPWVPRVRPRIRGIPTRNLPVLKN
jgi:hypothetical protein